MKKRKFFDYLAFWGYGLLQLFADACKIVGAVTFLAGVTLLFSGFWFWIFPWESLISMVIGAVVFLGGHFLKKWIVGPPPTPKDKEVKDDAPTE